MEDPEPTSDIESDSDDEFSLDLLGEAYAKVIREQNGVDEIVVEDGDGEESSTRGELVAEKVARNAGGEDDYFEELEQDDAEDDDLACPVTPESIVESILFVGAPRGEKLTSKKIAAILRDVSPKEVTKIAKSLNRKYEKENCAYRVEIEGSNLRLKIADDLIEFQNEFNGRNKEFALSQAAIDVLAVVAYRQPTSREEIEKVRNRPVGGVLNQLVKRNLLVAVPNPDNGRQKLFQTTDRFLDLFHLESLEDLPQSHAPSDFDDFEG
jgi:segregation and condensation protein B